ncbi:MAG TPA: TrfB-related DNA-binding protein [Pseudonocardiaceae bacterium]|jgi:DNA invertase Pin-like site-specific DNA recombinase|nr:TrfB-related DNA-binding protein [Pseudonocardiaceae bacterium]
MSKHIETKSDEELFTTLKEVRAAALEHARKARELARERRELIDTLVDKGFSQADIARELGVTRQAIQKMVTAGQ